MAKIEVGSKVSLTHPTSNGGYITFKAKVVKLEDDAYWVEIPPSVRRIPFPPVGGKRYAKFMVQS